MFRFDPRQYTVTVHAGNSPNPHGVCFDSWGRHYANDGTGGRSYQVRPEGVIRAGNVTVTVLESDFRDPENPNATVPGVAASYYVLPNDTAILPDFNGLESYATSIHERIDFPSTNGEFADTGRNDDFGVVWTGWLDIPTSGNWTLGTESDDGSRLFIGDEVVVDNDGLHGMQSRSGTIGLDAGRHAIRIEFFERGGGAGCIVKTGGPGVTFGVIPDSMWSHGGSLGPNPDINGDGLSDIIMYGGDLSDNYTYAALHYGSTGGLGAYTWTDIDATWADKCGRDPISTSYLRTCGKQVTIWVGGDAGAKGRGLHCFG